MTKYIRTKDGIISTMQTVRKADVVKYGDTIEELCDEIVVVKENEKPIINTDFGWKLYQKHTEHIRKHRATIYGSIWVDNNLIKVAKMNEKGELELL